jgi:hypothetical protein
MSTRSIPAASVLLLACLLVTAPALAQERYPSEPNLLEVLFIQESAVRLVGGELVDLSGPDATAGVAEILAPRLYEWERLSDVPEIVIDEWETNGELATGEDLYNLNNIHRLRFALPLPELWLLAADLEALPGVYLAYPAPLPQELPVPGSFLALQGYLNPATPAPAGVNAFFAWTQAGGTGAGVTVCDIEYDWNYSHQDVAKALGSQINLNVSDPFAGTAYPSQRHDTAVIGELVSDSNGWGTTGVGRGARLLTCGSFYGLPPAWNVSGAMTVAMASLQAGDVILLEQQWDHSGSAKLGRFIPIEWWNSTTGMRQQSNAVYFAIQTAVANGIHVVEAGGNGNVDTGTMTWWGDSGAIIVGAGGTGLTAHGDRVRMGFSSYGPRFDLQGWGENAVTTGHNFDLHSAEGLNLHYTQSFSGTSSASPIVAGAVVCVQGWWAGLGQATPITPALMRSTLRLTGTAQDSLSTGVIGPRPDLQAAIAALTPTAQWADATTGPLGDTGLTNSIAWGDRDGDGDPDLYVGNWVLPNRLLRNDLVSFFDALQIPESDVADAAGVSWVDYDNDGWLDIHITTVNGLPDRLFRNMNGNPGPGGFVDLTGSPLDDMDDSRDGAWADYDDDGDLDLYLANFGSANRLMRNDINNSKSWLHVKLVGTANNASGIGARVTIWSQTIGRQVREVSDMTAGPGQGDLLVEFGVAGDAAVDSLRVDWPNGHVQRLGARAVNQVLVITDDTATAVSGDALPARLALRRAWPNPFNPSTTIEYDVPRAGDIDLSIYDARGRFVRSLRSSVSEPGRHAVAWDGRDRRGEPVGAGVYLARLTAAGEQRTLKLMLLK